MRNFDPNCEYDAKEVKLILAEPWQLAMLAMNPDYTCWGNYEDYMIKNGDAGWDRPVELEGVSDLLGWELNDYNEVANFYFTVQRDNCECPHCEGSGLNPATKELSDSWYSFDKSLWIDLPNGTRYNDCAWHNHLTEVEIKALIQHGRLWDLMDKRYRFDREENTWKEVNSETDEWVDCPEPTFPTPEVVNNWSKSGFGHDSINQWICVRARAEHLGVYGHCKHCEDGRIYSGESRLGLQLWVLHPRKGASRGVFLKDIKQDEIPQVIAYLKEAANRNAERFSKL